MKRAVLGVAAACAILRVAPAEAQSSTHRLTWDPAWTRTGPLELGISGTLAGAIVVGTLADLGGTEHTQGGVLLDEGVRDLLRADGEDGRHTAKLISDVLLLTAVAQPLVDAGLVAWAGDKNSDVAGQMFAIDFSAFAVSGFLNFYTKALVGRARPYSRDCSEDRPTAECASADRTMSFFSGHAATTFTAAGLACAHHSNLPLYGSAGADVIACAGMMSLATATGLLRIVADKHYLSDVLVGAAVGTASGLLLPLVLHYHASPVAPPGTAGVSHPLVLSYGFGF
jgi:membrane-associated phospholipid phosphatase